MLQRGKTPDGGDAGGVARCSGCGLCVRECAFLQKAGDPARILREGSAGCDPFQCTLCGLCAAVCPIGVDPAAFFLELRREERTVRGGDDRRHAPLISYERRGTSPLFTFYGLPSGCDTVFFPGCALPGTRPGVVRKVYAALRAAVPNVGIVLDCCLKPSHDLGREEHFRTVFGEMREFLCGHGIRNVLVACPNCYRMFSTYGGGLSVRTVYEILPGGPSLPPASTASVVIHDPCVSRFLPVVQEAARDLARRSGLVVGEMPHSRERTICCGRGGGVNFVAPGVLEDAVALRAAEADGKPVVTYCAACAGTFATKTRSLHLLDVWAAPEPALAGRSRVSAAPVTYLNRLLLKRDFRRSPDFAVRRERATGGIVSVPAAGLPVRMAGLLRRLFSPNRAGLT